MNNDFTFDPKRSQTEIAEIKTQNIDPRSGPIKRWSFSGLMNYESCAYKVFLQYVKHIFTESGPQAQRGIEVHDNAEAFVKGEVGEDELHKALLSIKPKMLKLREMYAEAKVICEDEWAFTVDWKPVAWKSPEAWARFKVDAMIMEEGDTSAIIIDYKTGQKIGNELKHSQQALFYALAAFKMYDHLEFIKCEWWYVDQQDILEKKYTREYVMQMMAPKIEARAIAMTTETDFTPKPNKGNCRWCWYNKSGDCEWAEPLEH